VTGLGERQRLRLLVLHAPVPLPMADHGTEPERYEDGTEVPRAVAERPGS